MQPVRPHRWDLTPDEAVALQRELAGRVVARDEFAEPLRLVGGVDVAYREDRGLAIAAAVILDIATLQVRESAHAEIRIGFPYVPGLLSFREIPAIESALGKLTLRPDLLVCDGHGIAHPRRFGLASHVGFLFDLPAIGCAKSSLRLRARKEPGLTRGSSSPLIARGQVVGAVLRTRDGVKPLYVSPGHRLSVATACELVLRMCTRYRLPEPTRLADQAVNRLRTVV